MLDSERQEEAVRDVARQLAQIGDRLEGSIHPGMVASLASRFSIRSLSEEVSGETTGPLTGLSSASWWTDQHDLPSTEVGGSISSENCLLEELSPGP